jgi:hypothetical protein
VNDIAREYKDLGGQIVELPVYRLPDMEYIGIQHSCSPPCGKGAAGEELVAKPQ